MTQFLIGSYSDVYHTLSRISDAYQLLCYEQAGIILKILRFLWHDVVMVGRIGVMGASGGCGSSEALLINAENRYYGSCVAV